MSCPVCGLRLPLGPALEAHVNSHFDDDLPPSAAAADGVIDLTGDDTDLPAAAQGRNNAPLWPSLAPGALPQAQRVEPAKPACIHAALRRALLAQASSSKGPSALFRAALCGPPLLHYSGTKGVDAGWGCGWRNTQMLCAHLLAKKDDPRSQALFCGSAVLPDVGSLQAWLERAWALGIDVAGASQYGGRVQGTTKWIGACDAAALLRQFGLHARVVAFKATAGGGVATAQPAFAQCDACSVYPITRVRYKSQSRADYDLCGACHASRPDLMASCGPFASLPVPDDDAPFGSVDDDACAPGSHRELLEWMWTYFTTPEAGQPKDPWLLGQQVYVARSRHPLFLQHAGHSRTVVGIERRPRRGGGGGGSGGDGSDQWSLLVLDPGTDAPQVASALASPQAWPRLVKRGAHTLLKRREYEVIVVAPRVSVSTAQILRDLGELRATPPEAVFAP